MGEEHGQRGEKGGKGEDAEELAEASLKGGPAGHDGWIVVLLLCRLVKTATNTGDVC